MSEEQSDVLKTLDIAIDACRKTHVEYEDPGIDLFQAAVLAQESIKNLRTELSKVNENIQVLIETLEFYRRNHHRISSTEPNFAKNALDAFKRTIAK